MTYYKFLNANSKLIIIKHYSPLYLEKHLWHHYTIMHELCIDLHWFQTHQNITSYKWLMQCLNTFIKVIMITFFGKSFSPQSINQSNCIINQSNKIYTCITKHTYIFPFKRDTGGFLLNAEKYKQWNYNYTISGYINNNYPTQWKKKRMHGTMYVYVKHFTKNMFNKQTCTMYFD